MIKLLLLAVVPFMAEHRTVAPKTEVSTNFYGSVTGIVDKAYVEGLGIEPVDTQAVITAANDYTDSATGSLYTATVDLVKAATNGVLKIESDPTIGLTNGTIYIKGETITPLTSFTETDPTVPDWAKQANPPEGMTDNALVLTNGSVKTKSGATVGADSIGAYAKYNSLGVNEDGKVIVRGSDWDYGTEGLVFNGKVIFSEYSGHTPTFNRGITVNGGASISGNTYIGSDNSLVSIRANTFRVNGNAIGFTNTGNVAFADDLKGYVPTSRKINGVPLTDDITIQGMPTTGLVWNATAGKVKTANGAKTIGAADVGALPSGEDIYLGDNSIYGNSGNFDTGFTCGSFTMWSDGSIFVGDYATGEGNSFWWPSDHGGIIATEYWSSLSAMLDDAAQQQTRTAAGTKVMTLIDQPVSQKINNAVSANMNTYIDGETGVEYVGKFYGESFYYVPTGNVYPPNN